MTRMRIAIVAEATEGGVRRHVTDLACGLNPARFDVTVLCANRRDRGFGDDIRAMRQRGVRVVVAPMVRSISPGSDAVAGFALWRLMRRGRYDVVHTHSSKAGFLGRLAARLAGVRVVLHTPHAYAFQMETGALRKALYRALERWAARWTSRFVCVCQSEAEEGFAAGLGPIEKFVVIPNGVGDAFFRADPDRARARRALGVAEGDLVVGAAGRLMPQKGFTDWVDAAAAVVRRVPQARFVLAGEGPLRRALERRIRSHGLAAQVRLIGQAADPPAFYAALDVFVLPSLWESLPYALLEAMAAGLPVVATRVGGVPVALEGGAAGILVPPAEPEALGGAIAGLLEDADQRRALGASARAVAWRRYRVGAMTDSLARLYETMAG